ncbi:MAG: hypothetical protein A3C93_06630 [Candidatus Lloydbacteria bacterium RIFCSPHIGHO2_02_FULL_54_17]|uniref:Non-canonical purine NTP pyrophosphatase n=1 Tax=Candidatus Lloydbacteria bacterium RIFCSPHIGHO2_02_FULL_54_17 TaxID=1798664 RepID=A0A1G2DC28_9BACT|nr:MAG: hypothetical protein A2762_05405 [Candidatus Lloydbacteria bacterium RIFCSPHIGHO2_01_FULL_54_11]OGZ11175.1 MAG: hypothetical protein A3C93_06630 [Candidatus Lloydbacteria bacterium RIFCSPHIGHO2_02_FULL_54_17]OGZ14970.1 MAG: hypothetical protein A2948_00790 [Candidatus Lloydbacteria bacterium RIFCSPLOWO2_01_FULL_54_18]
MELCFVTTNKGKVASLRRTCEPFGITIVHVPLELPEPQVSDLRVITEHKAHAAYREVGAPLIVQDSGFFLDAWRGFPGPFVKFTLDTLGIDGYLALVAGRSRKCEFRECLAFTDGAALLFFESTIPGSLAHKREGVKHPDAWSELWEIFIPEGFVKTIADMTLEERAEWRARRGDNSASLFARWYAKRT